ncbi:hypothetical protein PoB_005764900 [Plakobranchus ocellatus]|uniref:Uncharacterized protein n=1 Tax=Plakobranchus ocellatus TaxID=259542 RepID=A0AAV4CET2_9GAST|nr:hypothetical protein PoB_005764900 [Plakobranchus ocellatus]
MLCLALALSKARLGLELATERFRNSQDRTDSLAIGHQRPTSSVRREFMQSTVASASTLRSAGTSCRGFNFDPHPQTPWLDDCLKAGDQFVVDGLNNEFERKNIIELTKNRLLLNNSVLGKMRSGLTCLAGLKAQNALISSRLNALRLTTLGIENVSIPEL